MPLTTLNQLKIAVQSIIKILTNKADKSEIVQPNWNQNDDSALDYIKNRTHYDSRKTTTISGEITYDGNKDDKEYVGPNNDGSMLIIKVSDLTPQPDSVIGQTVSLQSSNGTSMATVSTDDIQDEGTFCCVGEFVIIVYEDIAITDTTTLTKGTWFLHAPSTNDYVSSLGYSYTETTGELKQLDEKYLPETARSDWSVNDESATGYIKNRPFYEEYKDSVKVLSGDYTFNYAGLYYAYTIDPAISVEEGDKCTVIWNGVTYQLICKKTSGGTYYIGNATEFTYNHPEWSGIESDDAPFVIFGPESNGFNCIYKNDGGSVNITIRIQRLFIKELDTKYLSKSVFCEDNFLDVGRTAGKTVKSSNNDVGEIFNDYILNVASGHLSHAEGNGTQATSIASHAEGASTTASGIYSHSEGRETTASGSSSHAEGANTTASGSSAHAEGYCTEALGQYSHAEGKYNVVDSSNTYAHIVGNGTSTSKRSNAHTLDWKGNAWFAGDVYIGSTSGTNKDTGSKKLATEEYVDSAIPTKTSDITNDSGFLTSVPEEYITETELTAKGYLTSYTETDPTVPAWAKAETKPTYTADEVGAVPTERTVNGKALSSDIALSASDVGAIPDTTVIPSIDGLASESYVDTKVAGLVNSAPETLDTLNELAAALGNDANFSTTVATQIGGKVDKVDGKDLSTNDYTTEEKTKLSGIAVGAEVNVQSDWNEIDTNSDAYIKNKPTIPTVPESLKNPNALTVGGKTYDGSAAVTIEASDILPSVTAADNGKILQVVNGVWAAVSITDANNTSY